MIEGIKLLFVKLWLYREAIWAMDPDGAAIFCLYAAGIGALMAAAAVVVVVSAVQKVVMIVRGA